MVIVVLHIFRRRNKMNENPRIKLNDSILDIFKKAQERIIALGLSEAI